MRSVVATFPRQAPLPANMRNETEPVSRSGFFGEVIQALPASRLAAAIALAVHRGLVEQPSRKRLPLR
jgi:hypothetical protein